jgi:hypothetical protein
MHWHEPEKPICSLGDRLLSILTILLAIRALMDCNGSLGDPATTMLWQKKDINALTTSTYAFLPSETLPVRSTIE